MKKLFTLLASLILTVLLIFSFTSCTNTPPEEPKDPTIETVFDNMGELQSYKVFSQQLLKMNVFDRELTLNATSNISIVNGGEGGMRYNMVSSQLLSANKGNNYQLIDDTIGYCNGNAYVYHKSGSVSHYLMSEMTESEFAELIKKQSVRIITDVDYDNFVGEIDEKTGTWTFVGSDFSEEQLGRIADELQLYLVTDSDISNMTITFLTTEELYIKSMSMTVTFIGDDESEKPTMTYTQKYFDYNCTTVSDSLFDDAKYTKVENVAYVFEVDSLYNEMLLSDNGKIEIDGSYQIGSADPTEIAIDLSYGESEGKFEYYGSIKDVNGTRTVKYKNGSAFVSGEGGGIDEISDSEARQYLIQIASNFGYERGYIVGAIKGDGQYTVTCSDAFLRKLNSKITTISYKEGTGTFVFYVVDGRVSRIELNAEINCSDGSYSHTKTIKISQTLEYTPGGYTPTL